MPPLAPRLGRRNITPETVRLLWRFTRRMPPNQEAVHGRDAILAQLKAGKDRGFAQVKIAVTAADSSGDIGYGTGTYVVTGADGSHVDHGKWMLASKKVNGNWVTQCDIFNSDMPMPSGAMK
jgi:ketosteroid isomerase-like protein